MSAKDAKKILNQGSIIHTNIEEGRMKQAKDKFTENHLSKIILGASLKVHRSLGPGLLESAYQKCLIYELQKKDLFVEYEKSLPVVYEDVTYRIDLMINQKVIIELKSVESLQKIHVAQMLTYLKLSDCKLGLLINFNRRFLKDGFRRIVNNL